MRSRRARSGAVPDPHRRRCGIPTKISTLRGDYRKADGTTGNRLRLWEKRDFKPRPDDIFQERLYCVQWMRPKNEGQGRRVRVPLRHARTICERERIVEEFVAQHLADWQAKGWVPDMRIEPGPPRYQD